MAQVSIQEVRIAPVTVVNTTHTNAALAAWTTSNATVLKLRVLEVKKDGLTEPGIQDATLQTRLTGAPAPLKGLQTGNLGLTTYLGSGPTSGVTADPYATIAGRIMGTIASPTTQKWFYVGATSNTSNIVCNAMTDCGLLNGMGVLIGGEARIATNVQPTYVTLNMALSSAPAAASNAIPAHSAHFEEAATQYYFDWLTIGKSTADQRQGLAAQTGLKLSGLAPGEAPRMELDLKTVHWRWCPANSRATIAHATPSGNDPPTGYQYGGFLMADAGSQVARAAIRAAQFAIDAGINWSPRTDPNGNNALGGWIRDPMRPTMEFTVAYDEDMPGLFDDFEAKTAKQVMLQLGTAAGKTVLIYFPRFFLDAAPTEAALNNEAGLKIVGHGDDNYQSGFELYSSSMSLHWF